jgi:endonuclease/exonuclease/phosphatase (EEP) superfamily protein YafD
MKYRIAIWAAAGFLVASGWAVYFFARNKDLPIEPIMSVFIRLSCPIAIVGSHHPVSLYSALAANVTTYAVAGLVLETLRRQFNRSN